MEPLNRNLLMAALAAKTDFVDLDTLQHSLRQVEANKEKSLAGELREQGVSIATIHLLEEVVEEHLRLHKGELEESIAAALGSTSPDRPFETILEAGATIGFGKAAQVAESTHVMDDATRVAQEASLRTTSNTSPSQPGEYGRYQPLDFVARGGIGEIYRARDEELGRDVALKRIQARHQPEVAFQERFVLEAEVTGSLEHPNIVPVYGLGRDSQGCPYYSMRLIHGDSLTDHIARLHANHPASQPTRKSQQATLADSETAEAADMTSADHDAPSDASDPGSSFLDEPFSSQLRKLLSRLIPVCHALHYAHSRGVLHRDIKPDNIMLGPYGETLVMDWGLAKLIDESKRRRVQQEQPMERLSVDSNSSMTATQDGALIGTVSFMSPEQSLGWHDSLTPASDVYSLGAVLYAILTGRRPLQGSDLNEMLHQLQQGEIDSPRSLNKRISPALDAICRKAMSTRPGDRYKSAVEFADDLDAFLADEPVSAWKDSWLTRTRRWSRKHPGMTGGVVVGFVVLLIAMLGGMLLINDARQKENQLREEAIAERDRSRLFFSYANEAVQSYLSIVTDDPDLDREGLTELRERLLQSAIPFFEKIAQEEEDESVALAQAEAHARLGLIRQTLGDYLEAEQEFLAAIDLFENFPSDHHDQVRIKTGLAAAYTNLAVEKSRGGQYQESDDNHRRAGELLDELTKLSGETVEIKRRFAVSRNNYAVTLIERGDFAEAEQELQTAIELSLQTVANEQAEADDVSYLLGSYANLALTQVSQGQLEATRQTLDVALELASQWEPELSEDHLFLSRMAGLQGKRGESYYNAGDYDAALSDFDRAIEIMTGILSQHRENVEYQGFLANLESNAAVIHFLRGEATRAGELFESSTSRARIQVSIRPNDLDSISSLANTLMNFASLQFDQQDYSSAESIVREAIELHQRLNKELTAQYTHAYSLATDYQLLARIESAQGGLPGAIDELSRSIEILEEVRVDAPEALDIRSKLATCLSDLGDYYFQAGQYSTAEQRLERALKLQDEIVEQGSAAEKVQVERESTRLRLANVAFADSRIEEASIRNSIAIENLELLKSANPMNGDVASLLCVAHLGKGQAQAEQGLHLEAAASFQTSFDMRVSDLYDWLELEIARQLALGWEVEQAMEILRQRKAELIASQESLFDGATISAEIYLACVDPDFPDAEQNAELQGEAVATFVEFLGALFELYDPPPAEARQFVAADETYSKLKDLPEVEALLKKWEQAEDD